MRRLVVFAAMLPVLGFAAGDPLSEVRACTAIGDDARRLACFDAAMKETQAATPAVAGTAADAPVANTATKPASAEENFGYRGTVAREELDRQAAQAPKLEQLDAKVIAVGSQPHGQFIVTLDNQQVWAQKTLDSKVRPAVGDVITIKPAALGSFMLVTASGRSTRVTRVK